MKFLNFKDIKKKISSISINIPFIGVTFETNSSLSKKDKDTLLKRAKAFEAGRILMGTFIQLSIDNNYEFKPYIERVSLYLESIGVENINFEIFKKDMGYEELKILYDKISSQLWGKYSDLALYFDAGINLFMTITNNDIKEFSNIISNLELPDNLKKERESTIKWLKDLRNYFESIIFTPDSIKYND